MNNIAAPLSPMTPKPPPRRRRRLSRYARRKRELDQMFEACKTLIASARYHAVSPDSVIVEVRRLNPQPGDLLLFKVPADTFPPPAPPDDPDGIAQSEFVQDFLYALRTGVPEGVDVRIVMMDGDLEVSVVEKPSEQ